jgi:hypothetical protein
MGMKSFLKSILVFVLPIFVIAVFFDFLISTQLKSSKTHANREYPVWNDLYDGKINTNVLVMGSSRAWRHIDPKVIKDSLGLSAYNIGMDGQHLPMQLSRYQTFLKYNKQPKIIIYSLDFFMLKENEKLFNKDQFLPYMLFNFEILNKLKGYQDFNYYDFTIPLVRYYGATNALMHTVKIMAFPKLNKEGRVDGFLGTDKKWNNDFEKAKKKMKNFSISIDKNILIRFDNFLLDCKNKNIKVYFVYSPEYVEGQRFVLNRNELINCLHSLANKHKIPFLNYSNDEICLNKKYFYNTTHLNSIGADLFSKKMCSDLKNIYKLR